MQTKDLINKLPY